MPKPSSPDEAAAFLLDCVRKGCLGDGDARAVRLLLAERKAMKAERKALKAEHLALWGAAASACDLLDTLDQDFKDERAEALHKAVNATAQRVWTNGKP